MPLSIHLTFLGNPEWQGVGALMAVVAIAITVFFELRRRRVREHSLNDVATAKHLAAPGISPAPSKLYDLSTDEGEERFYRELAESIRRAKTVIYRSGRGFTDEPRKSYSRDIIMAEDAALKRGVEIVRIQTADRVSKEWAEQYARLMEKYPGNLRVYADFKDPRLVNVSVIDPDGSEPEIGILFESTVVAGRPSYPADAAISIFGANRVARSIHAQFDIWISNLRILDADALKDLSHSYLYFAYGSNMSPSQMRQRCLGAVRIGTAIAYGWSRNFKVAAPHMGPKAAAAGIEKNDDPTAYVEGVVYDLTVEEKRAIDEIEAGGYKPDKISFKLGGKHVEGFTHIPIYLSPATDLVPTREYIESIIEGAETNGLNGLARELRLSFPRRK
jgi:gamma-glutamyl AIG2-like cyclotransferase